MTDHDPSDLDTLTRAWDRLAPGPAPVEAMLRTHHVLRRRRRLVVLGSAAAVAAVVVSLGVQAQRTTPEPRRPLDPLPATTAPDPTPTPTPSEATEPTEATDGRATVYYLLEGSGLPYVAVKPMRVRTDAPLEALFSTEPPREAGFAGTGNPWLDIDGRPLARLGSVEHAEGVVTVDLTRADDALRQRMHFHRELALLQVACTAQDALGTSDPVRVTLRDERVRLFGLDASDPRSCSGPVLTSDRLS